MEKHQVDERKQTNTDHQGHENSNEDTKGKLPAPTENDTQEGDKETELPGIGDDKETKSDDVKMSAVNDTEANEESDEDSPTGDSDAAPVTNRKENEVVNQ